METWQDSNLSIKHYVHKLKETSWYWEFKKTENKRYDFRVWNNPRQIIRMYAGNIEQMQNIWNIRAQ